MDLHSAIVTAAGVTVVFVFVAYWMAAEGFMMETRFGRVVFVSAILLVALWLFITEITPNLLSVIDLSSFDLALLFIGSVLVAGVGAAFFDLVEWLRGEPPPPFE